MAVSLPDTLDFAVWDVFTDQPFSGNPLAIVTGAQALDTGQMQIIARQFNLSETIFVMPPRDPAHSARVRIFFPTAEIPFAGHPTIGCAIFLATQGAHGDFETRITLEEEAGLVPVTVRRTGNKVRAELQAPVVPFARRQPDLPAALIADGIGLYPAQIGPASPGVFEGGPRFLYLPVKDEAALSKARPHEPHWSEIMQRAGVDSAYLYCWTGEGRVQARMFSPTAGIPEDPATGSAAAILAAHLLDHTRLAEGETRITIRQGVEMGRPSLLEMRCICKDQTLQSVHVAGSAAAVAQGQIRIP